MKALNLKAAIVGVLLSALVCFGATNSFATDIPLQAPVTILETFTIDSANPMDFGTVEAPAVGEDPVTVIITAAGGGSIGGTATRIVDGTRGDTTVSGSAGQTFDLSAVSDGCTLGLTLTAFNYSTNPTDISIFTLPVTTQHGATLTIDDSVIAGNVNNCDYTITAAY